MIALVVGRLILQKFMASGMREDLQNSGMVGILTADGVVREFN